MFSKTTIAKVVVVLEGLISLILIGAVVIQIIDMVAKVMELAQGSADFSFMNFLSLSFNVIIGVEVVKTLSQHSVSSAIELLVFTITRQIIIDHPEPTGLLISVLALFVLFITQKYLAEEGVEKRASAPIAKGTTVRERLQLPAGLSGVVTSEEVTQVEEQF